MTHLTINSELNGRQAQKEDDRRWKSWDHFWKYIRDSRFEMFYLIRVLLLVNFLALFNLSNLFKCFVALVACVDLVVLRPFPDLFVYLGP